ncbi:MAG: hypothetical protein NZ528_05110 [Caldilineales bacterium]|nr:hypothetical protein [Caldilineales bacterium]MDW8316237.1 hypothetical protein [Anaerolineae bacterium]
MNLHSDRFKVGSHRRIEPDHFGNIVLSGRQNEKEPAAWPAPP